MKLWKAWFDIRQRFILCVVLVTLLMAPEAVSVALSSAQATVAAVLLLALCSWEASIMAVTAWLAGGSTWWAHTRFRRMEF